MNPLILLLGTLLLCQTPAQVVGRGAEVPPIRTTTTVATTTVSTTTVATTTDSTGLSAFGLTLLDKVQTYVSDSSCLDSSVWSECSGTCTDDARSVFYSYIDGDYRIVISSGAPNHEANHDASSPNPNTHCEMSVFMKVPLSPEKGTTSSMAMGPTGLANTGSFVYNELSNTLGVDDVAGIIEASTLDSCNGHSDGYCRYHYHKSPECSNYGSCDFVGYMRDGYPIYYHCSINSVTLTSCYHLNDGASGNSTSDYTFESTSDCHLDENNGYDFDDGYGYLFTDDFPWVPTGYTGSAGAADLCFIEV